ncbi:hypothetical protein [Sulfitobacter dubius]|uniref:Uncharacterized protein n=1 Tax=Sulfitobacter dubius TaxID=218673 RepID=A0ABY3ZIM2_9RHOB|nr:hypothetical protein [Sulfitobacter dubius]UOA14526.1 hypothetical protein DSM109990_01332 [Sulfitobacter dubius]
MTEYELKQIELLAKIEKTLARIEARQQEWSKLGLPKIRPT